LKNIDLHVMCDFGAFSMGTEWRIAVQAKSFRGALVEVALCEKPPCPSFTGKTVAIPDGAKEAMSMKWRIAGWARKFQVSHRMS
jgi:hypothetical protein